MNPVTEFCPLCAIKHLARAKVRLAESKLGYPHEFWSALGEISLAEDHLVEQQPALAAAIRGHRKTLECNPGFAFPANELMSTVAATTGYALPERKVSWFRNWLRRIVG